MWRQGDQSIRRELVTPAPLRLGVVMIGACGLEDRTGMHPLPGSQRVTVITMFVTGLTGWIDGSRIPSTVQRSPQ